MNKLLTKIVGVVLGTTMAVGVGVGVAVNSERKDIDSEVRAGSSTYTVTSIAGTYSANGGTATENGITWTYDAATYCQKNSSKVQVGSKNNPQTSDWTYHTPISSFGSNKKVTAVSLTAYTTATTATYDISVGGSSVKSGSLATSSTTYSANSLNVTSGEIVFTLKGSSNSKAMYLCGFSVTYEDATIVAKHSVTYSDGDEGSYVVDNIDEGSQHTLVSFATTGFVAPNNKIFKCWSVGDQQKEAGSSITVNSDITVTAVWADKLSITYKPNNDTAEEDVVVFFASGTDQTIADNDVTGFTAPSESYVFNGWYTTSSGTGGTAYAVGSIQSSLSTSLVLYAQWLKLGPKDVIDLTEASYNPEPTEELIVWETNKVEMKNEKGSGTKVTNYIPTANSSTRFYANNTLTITPVEGFELLTATFTATTSSYANALANSSWTNATASADDTTVVVTFTNGNNAASATIGGTCGFTEVSFQFAELKTFTVTSSDTEVEVNDIILVEASVSGVKWSSSNNAIATVDEDGYVEGKSIGQVTITGSKAGYEDASVIIDVIQSTQPYINLTLTVNGDSSSTAGYTGQPFSVTASYANLESNPDAIEWSTSGTGSVTRTQSETGDTYSGTLTTAGTARITAKDTDGDTSAYVEITITQSQITGFSIDKTSLKLFVDDTETITASITEATGIYDKTVTWSTSNSSVATVDNGVVTAKGFGDAVVTARAGDGQTKTCSVSVNEELNDISESNPVIVNATIEAGELDSNLEYSSNGLSISVSSGSDGDEIRVYKNATITFEATDITEIVLTCTSSNPASGFKVLDGFTIDGYNGTWSGKADSVTLTAENKQVRITQIDISYTNNQTVHYVNTDDTYNAQKAAIQFAKGFNERLSSICKDSSKGQGQTDLEALSAAWNGNVEGEQSCLQIFNSAYATLTTEADRTAFINIMSKAESVEGGDVLQDALARYDWIVENRGLADFLSSNSVRDSVVESANPSLNNVVSQSTTITAVVIIVSVISMASIAGYFLLRKRKEQ